MTCSDRPSSVRELPAGTMMRIADTWYLRERLACICESTGAGPTRCVLTTPRVRVVSASFASLVLPVQSTPHLTPWRLTPQLAPRSSSSSSLLLSLELSDARVHAPQTRALNPQPSAPNPQPQALRADAWHLRTTRRHRCYRKRV